MRRLLVALGIVLVVATAAAAATGIPGLPRLAVGDSRFVPAPGPAPAEAQCVHAWNAHAPRAALRWIGHLRSFGARMFPNMDHYRSSSNGGKIVSGPMCEGNIFYAHTKYVDVIGIWKGGRVSVWSGVLTQEQPGEPASIDATVASDGTVHPFVMVRRQVPATIPGLPDPADSTDPAYTPSSRPAPTVAQCIRAWNTHAPRVTVQWIGGLAPYGAFVYTLKNTVRNGTVTVTGSDCAFQVFFGRAQYLEVYGVWKDGDVSAWSGTIGNRQLEGQNAAVAADGRIHLH